MAEKLDFLPKDYVEAGLDWTKGQIGKGIDWVKSSIFDVLVRRPLGFAWEVTKSALMLPLKAVYHAPIIPTGAGVSLSTPVDSSPSTNRAVFQLP